MMATTAMDTSCSQACRLDTEKPVATSVVAGPAWRRRRAKGQSTVEFSLILWPFLLLLLATCDYAQIYFYESSMRHALQVAGRFATTGGAKPYLVNGEPAEDTNGNSIYLTSAYESSNIMSRNESIRAVFRDVCLINMQDSNILITSWPGGGSVAATENNPNEGPGISEDFVRIEVSWPLSLVTPVASLLEDDGQYIVTVEGIFRNEPGENFNLFTDKFTGEPNSLP